MMYAPCDACSAPCCRENEVLLDGWDAYRIAGALKIPMADFVEMRFVEQPTAAYRVQLSLAVGDEPRWYKMTLRKLPEPADKHAFRCVFLVAVGARGRCGVHPVRPSACRLFPTSLASGIVSIAGDDPCPPGAWRVADIDVPLHRVRHLEARRQERIYNGLVDAWNERVRFDREARTERAFFDYLTNAYRELEAREPSLFDERSARGSIDERERAAWLVDEVVRELGFRTDETVRGVAARS